MKLPFRLTAFCLASGLAIACNRTESPPDDSVVEPAQLSENLICATPTYRAETIGDNLKIAHQQDGVVLNVPAIAEVETDDSTVYRNEHGEATYALIVNADETCGLRVTSAAGEVIADEVGQIESTPPPTAEPVTLAKFATNCHFVEVYERGDELRLSVRPRAGECTVVGDALYGDRLAVATRGQEGQEYAWVAPVQETRVRVFLPANSEANRLEFTGPNVVTGSQVEVAAGSPPPSPPPSPVPSPPPSPSPSPTEEPNQTPLALTCQGTIDDRVDFTVQYSREGGFSRATFRPRTSDRTLESNLGYDGRNEQGQAIWRGSVAGMADVTLVHLSAAVPQAGDQVSISYDGQWGRGTCR